MAAQGAEARRWRLPWRRRAPVQDLDPGRADLVVVAAGFDDAEASSAALERAASGSPAWMPSAQVLLRHHLLLPAGQVEDAVAVAAQDGYGPAGPAEPPGSGEPPGSVGAAESADSPGSAGSAGSAGAEQRAAEVPDARVLVLQRVQVLDALHCSQERSRMAGLAQRRGGVALGWEALQPLPPPG